MNSSSKEKDMKKQAILKLTLTFLIAAAALGTGCGQPGSTATDPADYGDYAGTDGMIHVSAESGSDTDGCGTEDSPFATLPCAAASLAPGRTIIVHDGTYDAFTLTETASGTEDAPVTIKAAEGESPVIKPTGDGDEVIGIHIVNAEHITIEGLEVEGGTHGIYYESTRDRGEMPLTDITIKDCTVHGVRGTHGICVYACNDLAPVKDLTMTGCEVYDCECGDSESTVFNGNIDGFEISGNLIHENNNIGIDMIGFEGNAAHPEGEGFDNLYDADYVRNGTCHDNVVYGISAEGNDAYLEDGEYDLCADGIYVDGGQDIEIYNNFVFCCDIGIEVATEHSPDDNPLFKVSGIDVHDNVVAGCEGWCGLCFGGYDADLGYTENCKFYNNTFIDNDTQIGVQRSKDNEVYGNLLSGGSTGVEYNEDCRPEDLNGNAIHDNVAAGLEEKDSWQAAYGKTYKSTDELLRGWTSRIEDCGSSFAPAEEYVKIYESWRED
jgi:hypothetical protein